MNEKLILKISFDEDAGTYQMNVGAGMSVNESMFGIAAFMRCLVRDKVVEDRQLLFDMLYRYLNDPQYEEVTPDDGQTEQSVSE